MRRGGKEKECSLEVSHHLPSARNDPVATDPDRAAHDLGLKNP